ncbi:MAG: hypothetical protein WCF36_10255 [Candidatus Nanopelagicales bacterium]
MTWWHDGWYTGWGAGWMVLMMLGWGAVLGLGVWALVALTRGKSQSPPGPPPETPGEVLDRRLAAGEITTQEYQEACTLLQTHPGPRSGSG